MVHLYKIQTIKNKAVSLSKAKDALETINEITKVNLDSKNYEFEIFMNQHISDEILNTTLFPFGISVSMAIQEKKYTIKDFMPLILIFIGILAFVSLKQFINGNFDFALSMTDFMAGFFLVFAFFKFLDLPGFADAYSTYDIVASRWKIYGFIYPFLEAILGIAYLFKYELFFTNIFTVLLMGVSSIGVITSLVQKRKIRCACLGTKINLPMTTITAIEDLLMLGMALVMLFISF